MDSLLYVISAFLIGILIGWYLAAQTPERIHDIISPKSWQAIDPAEWIAQARTILEQRSEEHPIENFM